MPRREWFPEAMLLIAAVGLVMVIFALTPLDIAAACEFYRPGRPDHWPLAQQFPCSYFYQLAPAITASLIVVGLVGLVAGQVYRHERWRAYGFLILCVVIHCRGGRASNALDWRASTAGIRRT